MLIYEQVQELKAEGRRVYPAVPGDDDLGPLKLLPGTWKNLPNLGERQHPVCGHYAHQVK